MRSAFTYREALKILGNADHDKLQRLDRILGGAILGSGAIGVNAMFALVDQKNEATRLARELLALTKGRWRKTAGHSRHELLVAAHTTIVVAALFEEFAAAVGEDVYHQLEITDAEKMWVMSGPDGFRIEHIKVTISLLLDLDAPLPTPARGFESVAGEHLKAFYDEANNRLACFLAGLSDAKLITLRRWESLSEVPAKAIRRYREYYANLAADAPEFSVWTALQGRSFIEGVVTTTAEQTTENTKALARVERMLRSMVDRDCPDEQAQMLGRLNYAYLAEPLARVNLTSDDLSFPTIEAGFVTPAYRVAVARRHSNVADPGWWQDVTVRQDLEEFFVGYLASPDATTKPLVVLGHPGAGKSMMTRVLAARLPTNLFVSAWVPLRRVDPDVPVHRQIEQAVEDFTNGRVSWRGLSDVSTEVTRVVILDGFDELMQATGVVQSRYLEDLAEFQRREREIGRPVSVVVTSRTVVADRARIPDGSVVLRLEDFDESKIKDWLDRWEATNATWFRTARYRALTLDSAKACAPLSSQPLLLMMIALYAANPDVPEPGGADVTLGALYHALIDEFVKRELTKDTRTTRVSEKMMAERRLSLGFTSFAMFNRARLYVDERTLERDFEFLYHEKFNPDATSLDEPLSRSQQTIGAFFFVHKSEVGREERRRTHRTYEFLHATVGEFLIARTVHELLMDAEAVWRGRRTIDGVRASADAPGGDQGTLLMDLLSSQTMARRPNIAALLSDLASLQPYHEKQVVVRFVRVLMDHVYDHGVAVRYDFVPTTQVTRQANLLANLVSITLALNGPTAVTDMSTARTIERWRSTVRLLRAGLDAESWLAFSAAYMVTQAGGGVELRDRIDPVRGGPLYRSSAAETADISEHLLLGLSQAELRLSTGGLHQLIETGAMLPYMTGFFDALAALLIYRNAKTDAAIYHRMAASVMSFPQDANDGLIEAIPLVLDVASRDLHDANGNVVASISLLLDSLRQRISNFAVPELNDWKETAFDWLQATYQRSRS
jgi:hypothetical protein